jgi:uncharacterized protein YidB (DUF937 family)
MNLIDELLQNKEALGGVAELLAKNPQILAAAASLLSTKDASVGDAGGLGGLLGAFQSKGLGDLAASWVGTGQNRSISPDQVASVLGNDTLSQFASKAGIGLDEAGPALAALLPMLVDRTTPKGQVPDATALEGSLGGLLSGLMG